MILSTLELRNFAYSSFPNYLFIDIEEEEEEEEGEAKRWPECRSASSV